MSNQRRERIDIASFYRCRQLGIHAGGGSSDNGLFTGRFLNENLLLLFQYAAATFPDKLNDFIRDKSREMYAGHPGYAGIDKQEAQKGKLRERKRWKDPAWFSECRLSPPLFYGALEKFVPGDLSLIRNIGNRTVSALSLEDFPELGFPSSGFTRYLRNYWGEDFLSPVDSITDFEKYCAREDNWRQSEPKRPARLSKGVAVLN